MVVVLCTLLVVLSFKDLSKRSSLNSKRSTYEILLIQTLPFRSINDGH